MPKGTVAPGYVCPWPPVPIAIFTYWVISSEVEDVALVGDSAFGVAGASEPKRRVRGKADRAAMNLRRDIIMILFQEDTRWILATARPRLTDCARGHNPKRGGRTNALRRLPCCAIRRPPRGV